jgi:hypothetical protein
MRPSTGPGRAPNPWPAAWWRRNPHPVSDVLVVDASVRIDFFNTRPTHALLPADRDFHPIEPRRGLRVWQH